MQISNPHLRKTAVAIETIVTIAILIALSVVCSMALTVRVGTALKFSPVFVVSALAARRYGPLVAGLVALMADIIQFFMFPTGLPFSFGICLSGVLSGIILGWFMSKKVDFKRIVAGVLSSQILCSLILTTFVMVYVESWSPLFPLVYWRALQTIIMIVIEIILLYQLFVKIDLAKITKIVK